MISNVKLLSLKDLSHWLLIIEQFDPYCRIKFYCGAGLTQTNNTFIHSFHVLSINALKRVVAVVVVSCIEVNFLVLRWFLFKIWSSFSLQILNKSLNWVILIRSIGQVVKVQFLELTGWLFVAILMIGMLLSFFFSLLSNLVVFVVQTFYIMEANTCNELVFVHFPWEIQI